MPGPAAAVAPEAKEEGLSVIALVSGGKDSFFSILHCLANGHHVVALANLHPPPPPPGETAVAGASSTSSVSLALDPVDRGAGVILILPGEKDSQAQGHGHGLGQGQGQSQPGLVGKGRKEAFGDSPAGTTAHHEGERGQEDEDLNSFMYQTVGHQVIPLYAEATGLPLYRKAIVGGAGQHGKDYSHTKSSSSREDTDETESMIPLLRAIKAVHPEANAICAGAILSTYQRTRVESVATRLGLVPLAYLWKFPTLPFPMPSPGGPESDAQLLDDMAAVGLEARIIKVASGGLDESFLWTNVASAAGKDRIARSMRRFGTAEKGAVIGEGGEFETLVLDGPSGLFKKRIVIDDQDRKVIYEGGGTAYLSFHGGGAHLEAKEGERNRGHAMTVDHVRTPDLLDDRFVSVIDALSGGDSDAIKKSLTVEGQKPKDTKEQPLQENLLHLGSPQRSPFQQWSFIGGGAASITEETTTLTNRIRQRLSQDDLTPSAIINSTIVLRRMVDFPAINLIYGSLFEAPNPPSRVTISCGDALLPPEANISISLAVHTSLRPGQRQGLHVQSRSYWAPANIGPYSQAISFPLGSLGSSKTEQLSSENGPRLVSIAGQIPLVPATMALPPTATDSLGHQLALSLQHLWRIGADVDVRWWTSGVVYFPRQNDDGEQAFSMRLRAQAAGKTWEAAHMWSGKKHNKEDGNGEEDSDEDDDEDDTGPDLWDRRFNAQYMSFAAAGDGEKAKTGQKLPDWTVLDEDESKVLNLGDESSKKARRTAMVPPLFAAEVEELPRRAGAEWHAHLGVAGGNQDSVVVLKGEKRGRLSVYQTAIRSDSMGNGVSTVQTIVAEEMSDDQGSLLSERLDASLAISSTTGTEPWDCFREQDKLAGEAVARLGDTGKEGQSPAITVRYLDVNVYPEAQEEKGLAIPIVPCRSLWIGSVRGERLASVTIHQSVFER